MAEPRTIHFVSLGCAKNRVDTEVMLGVSDRSGLQIVDDPARAEVIVVNTCGFIGPAKEESIDTILEMGTHKTSGRCKTLVVSGCLSQRYPEELARELPEVDHFLGSSDMLELRRVLAGTSERMLVGNPANYTMRADDPRMLSEYTHRAYVKIAEGCNRQCSFCAIPSFRGKQRSRSIADLVREAELLAAAGVVELNLISQDTIGYGRDLRERASLAQLLTALGEVDGIRWIRAHYLYPETLSDALVEAFAQHEKVLPYIDMPLQHASDA
ncbi:MAG: radical SAM protein, partial [Myxococcales bacterium]